MNLFIQSLCSETCVLLIVNSRLKASQWRYKTSHTKTEDS